MTDNDLRALYNRIYQEVPRYGRRTARDPVVIKECLHRLPAGSSILDAGCGRGDLMRALADLGYVVTGTEISDWLVTTELKGLEVRLAPYSELCHVPSRSFDGVISNGVLEHLPTKEHAFDAIAELSRIAKTFLAIAVSPRSSIYLETELHLTKIPFEEWAQEIAQHVTGQTPYLKTGHAAWFFGKPK